MTDDVGCSRRHQCPQCDNCSVWLHRSCADLSTSACTTNYQILAPPGAVTGAISLTIQVLIFILTILKYLTHLISCPDYRRIQTFLLSLPLLVSAQVSAARRSLIPTERIILRTSNLKLLDWAHQVTLQREAHGQQEAAGLLSIRPVAPQPRTQTTGVLSQ